jgi:hypothetical protein
MRLRCCSFWPWDIDTMVCVFLLDNIRSTGALRADDVHDYDDPSQHITNTLHHNGMVKNIKP